MNFLVYGREKGKVNFEACNIRTGKLGVGLAFASLIPEEKKELLIEYVQYLNANVPDIEFEIRYAGTGKKVNEGMV